jgi:precorrin-8X/cobalt-precorrin-8 methylmutase
VSGCEKSCAHSGRAEISLVLARQGVHLARDADVRAAVGEPVIALEQVHARLADVRVPPPMARKYDYERNGAEIYRRSFAIIRAESRLERFSPREERVAVRLIHTSGMVDLAEDILFTPGFAEAAERAIRGGAPILCDAKMIVSGVTRARLTANNPLLCFLDEPSLAALAREQHTTRSAAALELWREHLDGAVVAIGNAPTALFRLLELFDEVDARPAAVIGLPVGFVGAAESKDALLADGRVPAMIVRGRRGGSAMTVAAINALASDEE